MAKILSRKPAWSWRKLAPFAALTAAVGVVAVILASAAGTPTAFEPETGTLAAGAVTTTVAGQSGSGAVKFAAADTPTPTPGPGDCTGAANTPGGPDPYGGCWPGSNNTGYKNGGTDGKTPGPYTGGLTPMGSYVRLSTAGATYTHVSFLGGSTYIQAPNITCNGCRFQGDRNTVGTEGAVVLIQADGFTCNYCTVEGTGPIVNEEVADPGGYSEAFLSYADNVTIKRADVSGMGAGFSIFQHGHDDLVQDSYFHAPAYPSGSDHTSVINMTQNDAGSQPGDVHNITVDHNWLDAHRDNTQNIGFQGSDTYNFSYTNLKITNNMLMGSGYVLAELRRNMGVAGSLNWHQTTFTGNVFSTKWFAGSGSFGAVYMSSGAAWPAGDGSLWQNNKWYVPASSPGNPADNGKYLLPQGGTVLSATDYIQR